MKTINLNGNEYPVRVTMGALREFKKLTGKDVEQIAGTSDIGDFLFACAVSACRADKVEFKETIDTFVDQLDINASAELFMSLLEDAGMSATGGKKKTVK